MNYNLPSMKRIVQAIFFLACVLAIGVALLFFLRSRSESDQASLPIASKTITIEPPTKGQATVSSEPYSGTINRLTVKPSEVVLGLLDINLDSDEGDEQLLTIRDKDDPVGAISVVVADYLPSRGAWIRSWEARTSVTKLATWSLRVLDLAGDHSPMIVCSGLDSGNRQNLALFRRKPGSPTLAFTEAGTFTADSVDIEETDRPESYQLNRANASSWVVSTYGRDPSSHNLFDQIKTSYQWDFRRGRYVMTAEKRIPGEQAESAAVEKILTGSARDFEKFLQGVWYRISQGVQDPHLVYFDAEGKTVSFSSSADGQEMYRWIDSNATYTGVFIAADNESVPDLRRFVSVDLVGAETISVRVDDERSMRIAPENGFSGRYRRGGMENLPPGTGSGNSLVSVRGIPRPEGLYLSGDGKSVKFDGRGFTLDIRGKIESGGFNFYFLGEDLVLDLLPIGRDGLSAGHRLYMAEYGESDDSGGIVRSLVLSPVRMRIDRLEKLEEDRLSFEQKTR